MSICLIVFFFLKYASLFLYPCGQYKNSSRETNQDSLFSMHLSVNRVEIQCNRVIIFSNRVKSGIIV